jgi:aspartate/methionine/tyrosine aminotransferase
MSYALSPLVAAAIEPPIAEAKAWIAGRVLPADKPLLDLAQAEPSYPPAASLTEHLATLVRQPETARYTAIAGIRPLREALAAHLGAAYGGAVRPDQCFVTAGCNQAFCLAIMALARAGDEVILPVPYYFNHRMWLDMLGIRAVHLGFRPDRAGVPDPADAVPLIGPRTRAIVLVTPSNPTGAIYPPAVIEAFHELARSHGLALLIDETYKDFLGRDGAPHGLFRRPDWPGTLVHLYSFSKAFALTGYRVGAITAGPALLGAVVKIMDTVAICAPRVGQEAALYGLGHLDEWRAEKSRQMAGRLQALRAVFRSNRLTYRLISAGAFFAYVRHPFEGVPAAAVARRLADEQNILCLPGSMFGPGQDEFLRLAFGNVEAKAMADLGTRLEASQEV